MRIITALLVFIVGCTQDPDYKLSCESVKCGSNSTGKLSDKQMVVCEYQNKDWKNDYWSRLQLVFGRECNGDECGCWEMYSWAGEV